MFEYDALHGDKDTLPDIHDTPVADPDTCGHDAIIQLTASSSQALQSGHSYE